jgi:hypothetical protein
MNKKPISPKMHGVIDYAFATGLLVLPSLLGLNKKAKNLYKVMAAEMFLYSSLTDYPAGIASLIPYETHRKIDVANIAGMAADTLYKPIRKQKRAMLFHVIATTAALTTFLLTDWKDESESNLDTALDEPDTIVVTEEVIVVVSDEDANDPSLTI